MIRDEVRDFFRATGGEWELRVQLCTKLEDMPIEPANVEWSETESPYVAVARLRAARRRAGTARLRSTGTTASASAHGTASRIIGLSES